MYPSHTFVNHGLPFLGIFLVKTFVVVERAVGISFRVRAPFGTIVCYAFSVDGDRGKELF